MRAAHILWSLGAGKVTHWEPCTDLSLSQVKFLSQTNESKRFPSPRVCQLETKNYNCGPPKCTYVLVHGAQVLSATSDTWKGSRGHLPRTHMTCWTGRRGRAESSCLVLCSWLLGGSTLPWQGGATRRKVQGGCGHLFQMCLCTAVIGKAVIDRVLLAV